MRIKRSSKGWRVVRTLARRLTGPAAPGPRNAKQLTPEEMATILRANEFSKELEGNHVIKGYSTNCLAANINMEDRNMEAKLLTSEGSMFAVYDGHAGHMCADVLSNKLFSYIATALLPDVGRDKLFYSRNPPDSTLIERYRKQGTRILSEQIFDVYDELRTDWVDKLRRTKQIFTREDCLTKAFLRMDADLGKAAEMKTMCVVTGSTMMEAAMSGAVACVALIEGRDLYVAGTGDCGAVLGRQKKNGRWTAVKLNTEHTAKNNKEVDSLKSKHPKDEGKSIIQQGRLFGSLMPLRAFGDFRYKWPVDTLERVAVPTYGRQVISANYRTPPYLTANPDVVHRTITPEDKFIVLATDGLWDVLSPEMVVQLVGHHTNRSPSTLQIKKCYYEQVFPQRSVQEMITMSPTESYENPATYLLRAALGGSLDLVNRQLAVPLGEARNIRDDITVTVVFLKSDEQPSSEPNTKFEIQPDDPLTTTRPDPAESGSRKVTEPPKDKGGSMAHSTKWEDIETVGSDDQEKLSDGVDLDAALGSGGIIKSKSFRITGDPRKTQEEPPSEKT